MFMKTCILQRHLSVLSTLSLLAATALVASAVEQGGRGQLSSSDYKFATAAAEGGQLEVDLGNLASQKASNPQVQQFARQMVQDHSKANDQLKAIATKNDATLPVESEKDQKEMDRLNKLSGAEFDKTYMNLMIRDHKSDLKDFQRESRSSDNTELRTYAGQTASVIQDHLNMAENIAGQLKNTSTAPK